MVEFRDKDGKLRKPGLVEYEGLYHLATVVVTGTLRKKGRDYVIDGKSVYVKEKSKLDVAVYEKKKKELGK